MLSQQEVHLWAKLFTAIPSQKANFTLGASGGAQRAPMDDDLVGVAYPVCLGNLFHEIKLDFRGIGKFGEP